MKIRFLAIVIAVIIGFNSYASVRVQASDTISSSDFNSTSWSKTVDLFDYARAHAEAVGGTPPKANWTSDTVVNFVNQNGVKLLYVGLAGVDYGKAKFQVPLQSIVEQFNTTKGEQAMTETSFLMLMAFNDTKTSLYAGSPDKGDNLWASFSMGTDYSAILPEGKVPKLLTSVDVTPLKQDGNEYTWGMTYKDLAAVWWAIAGTGPRLIPNALCVYDELGFNYRLVFNPPDGTAKLYITYTIGAMRDLWTFSRQGILPTIIHLNATGTYNLRQQKIGSEDIHSFLDKNKISMSIIMGQRTWVADKIVQNKFNGSDASTTGVDVSSGTIQATTVDGEKVYDVGFGEKPTYKLETPSGEKTYNAITRTEEVNFYAKNPVLAIQNALLLYSNALVRNLFPDKYAETAKSWANATKADYLYATSYPTYGGYEVIHDPVLTAYAAPTKSNVASGGVPIPSEAILMGVIVAVIGLSVARRKQNKHLIS